MNAVQDPLARVVKPPSWEPDLSKPCVSCRWAGTGFWWWLLTGEPQCFAASVRGWRSDAVTGKREMHPPASCRLERGAFGACGPSGKFHEVRP